MAIRILPRQEELLADGNRVKHFAVVSNLWEWNAERLIQRIRPAKYTVDGWEMGMREVFRRALFWPRLLA